MLSNIQAGARARAVASTPSPPQSPDSTVGRNLLHVANDVESSQPANQRFVPGRDLVFGLTSEISQVRHYGSTVLGIDRNTVARADGGEPLIPIELFSRFEEMLEERQGPSGIPTQDDFFAYYSNPDAPYNVTRESRVPDSGDPHRDAELKHNEQLRRMSKATLDVVLANGGTIHFLLDSLDMDVVLDKRADHVTSSELRWLYRNREALEEQPGKVVFYRGVEVVEAPWQTEPDLWATYTPKSSG